MSIVDITFTRSYKLTKKIGKTDTLKICLSLTSICYIHNIELNIRLKTDKMRELGDHMFVYRKTNE